jgi:hypothetical protein
MDNETKQRISDYFDAWTLVELLGITTEEIVDAFMDTIEDRLSELDEIMEFKRD